MCGKVYGIYDRRTDECVYVGSTKFHIYCRWGQHISSTFAEKPSQPKLNTYLRAQGVQQFEPRRLHGTPDDAYAVFETRQDVRNAEQAWIDFLKTDYNTYRAVAKPYEGKQFVEYLCKKCGCCLVEGSKSEARHFGYRCMERLAWLKYKEDRKNKDPKDGPFPHYEPPPYDSYDPFAY